VLESLSKAIPESLAALKKRDFGAAPTATCLYDLNSVLEYIRRSDNQQRATHAAATNHINKAIYDLKALVSTATSAARQSKDLADQAKVVSLSTQQRDRKYLVDGFLPADAVHIYCPQCGHPSVDEPFSNRGIVERNTTKLQEWTEQVTKFDECKRKGTPSLALMGGPLLAAPQSHPMKSLMCNATVFSLAASTKLVMYASTSVRSSALMNPLVNAMELIRQQGTASAHWIAALVVPQQRWACVASLE